MASRLRRELRLVAWLLDAVALEGDRLQAPIELGLRGPDAQLRTLEIR